MLIDVSIIAQHDAGTGIQRVVRRIAQALLDDPPAGYTVRLVRATRASSYHYADSYAATLTGHADAGHPGTADAPLEARAGDIFVGLDLGSRIVPRRTNDLLAMRARGVRLAFVVYDLLPATHPHWFTGRAARDFRRWLAMLGLHADALLCISATIATEARHWFHHAFRLGDALPAIADFRLGSDFARLPDVQPRTAPAAGDAVSLLIVGTVEPRKGHAFVLDAMERLWARGVPVHLVIAGKPGWRVDTLAQRLREHPEAGKRLVWLQKLDDAELAHRYAEAHGLIMASEAEGFGLPLVEAALHGVPILARDLPVFREVAGAHARYFASGDAERFALAIETWAAELRTGMAPDSRGIELLTWAQASERFATLVRAVAEQGGTADAAN